VRRIALDALASLEAPGRTVYRFDVRTPEEYAAGHLAGFASAPGGQLVQETDHQAPVRGARIVLTDDDDVRANMSASWLAQMGWEVYVVEPVADALRSERGNPEPDRPATPSVDTVAPPTLAEWLKQGDVAVIDVTASANYVKAHVPGAWFAIRAQLPQALRAIPPASRYVLTCGSSLLARFAADDLKRLTSAEVFVLEGGTTAWIAAGLPVEQGETRLAVPRTDRYRRPYEGTDNAAAAMQAYLDWEFGLIAQLDRDRTHFFEVV
jgi:rhodanese-related sulfurtransferase